MPEALWLLSVCCISNITQRGITTYSSYPWQCEGFHLTKNPLCCPWLDSVHESPYPFGLRPSEKDGHCLVLFGCPSTLMMRASAHHPRKICRHFQATHHPGHGQSSDLWLAHVIVSQSLFPIAYTLIYIYSAGQVVAVLPVC